MAGAAALLFGATLIGPTGTADAATERRISLSDSNVYGEATRTPTPPAAGEVQLLRGFDFKFQNGDHHWGSAAVMPQNGDLRIEFSDRNSDDPMRYLVSLTNVRLAGVINPPPLFVDCDGGTCTYPISSRPSRDYIFVLRGFRLEYLPDGVGFPFPGNCDIFSGCDHHVSLIEVMPGEDSITTTLRDKNGDDVYTASIAYSWVPRSQVQRRTTVINGSDSGVDQVDTGLSGAAAISGFRIGYPTQLDRSMTPPRPYLPDSHILRFAYLLTTNGVEVAFHDNSPSQFQYRVNYVTFR